MNDYSKLLLGGCAVILVVSIGCWFWYQWEIEPYRQSTLEAQAFVNSSKVSDVPSKRSALSHALDDGGVVLEGQNPFPAEKSTDKMNSPIAVSELGIPTQTAQLANTDTEKVVRFSPHGLGPYPEIPEGWSEDAFSEDDTIEHELIERVRIKMYNEGTYTYGASMDGTTGLVYPITMDSVYVEWSTGSFVGLGEVSYIASLKGHPSITAQIQSNAESRQSDLGIPTGFIPMLSEDIPSGVSVLNEMDGIDPYDFLDLPPQ